jgi:hypothetical protein
LLLLASQVVLTHILSWSNFVSTMMSQRKISKFQAFEIETTNDLGIGPKAAHESNNTTTTTKNI